MGNVFWEEVDKGLAAKRQRRPWLADKTGIALGRINNWYVRGTLPRVDDAVAIADAVEVPVRQLVTGELHPTMNTVPDDLKSILLNAMSLPDQHREQLLTARHAVLILIDQGYLTMPLDTYFRVRERRSPPPSGSPRPSGRGPGGYSPA